MPDKVSCQTTECKHLTKGGLCGAESIELNDCYECDTYEETEDED